MLTHVISTLLMLLVVALAGWAVASLLRSPAPTRDPQQDWEFWLEASGMRPVIPRTRPVAEAASAIGRPASEVHRAAMGRAGDQALLVIAQLVGGETLIAAQRSGPLPPGVANVADGWQYVITPAPVEVAWARAGWLRTGAVGAR